MTKRLGSAVARNRLRRRLRPLVEAEAAAGRVPAGALLFSARPGAIDLDPAALRTEVATLLDGLQARLHAGRSPR